MERSTAPVADVVNRTSMPHAFRPFYATLLATLIAALPASAGGASAQTPPSQPVACSLSGTVVDAHGSPVSGADVVLRAPSGTNQHLLTDAAGGFRANAIACGTYQISAAHLGQQSRAYPLTLSPLASPPLRLTIPAAAASSNQAAPASQGIDFSDQPNFSIAGVTDWTAVGGHGSDAVLRTSEDLSRETARLQPNPAGTPVDRNTPSSTSGAAEAKLRAELAASPGSYTANRDLGELYLHTARFAEAVPLLRSAASLPQAKAEDQFDLALACQGVGDLPEAQRHVHLALAQQEDAAEFHALAGALAERLGDPVTAVTQLQRAAQLDPSEGNDLAWGSELLLHRAIWQAVDVFRNGSALHPASARLRSAWGAALFAGARYDDAAQQLCAASALDPASTEPYLFLGKMILTSATPLPCEQEALERFARQQPTNPDANYFLAMALLKQPSPPAVDRAQTLLRTAVTLDPRYAAADLQLGILASARKQYPEAVRDFEQAIAADPQLAEAHFRLGVAYDRTGDPVRARQQFQLHDELDRQQAEAVEQQRKQVKQFQVVLEGNTASPTAQP